MVVVGVCCLRVCVRVCDDGMEWCELEGVREGMARGEAQMRQRSRKAKQRNSNSIGFLSVACKREGIRKGPEASKSARKKVREYEMKQQTITTDPHT